MRSAPCFVRENTSTDSSAASLSRCTSAGTLAACETSTIHCATASTGVERAPISTSTGVFRNSLETASISFDNVAENSRVWRDLRRRRDDLPDRRQEAHVEHAVGLVQHQHLEVGEVHVTLLHQVEQAPWRGHDNVDAAAQGLDLRPFTDAAEDRGAAQVEVTAIGADVLFDLRHQLAGGRHDQRPHVFLRRRGAQPLEQGQDERRGLAGARLRHADDVAAFENDRDGLGLNRRRLDVALFLECGGDLCAEPERREWQLRT